MPEVDARYWHLVVPLLNKGMALGEFPIGDWRQGQIVFAAHSRRVLLFHSLLAISERLVRHGVDSGHQATLPPSRNVCPPERAQRPACPHLKHLLSKETLHSFHLHYKLPEWGEVVLPVPILCWLILLEPQWVASQRKGQYRESLPAAQNFCHLVQLRDSA